MIHHFFYIFQWLIATLATNKNFQKETLAAACSALSVPSVCLLSNLSLYLLMRTKSSFLPQKFIQIDVHQTLMHRLLPARIII